MLLKKRKICLVLPVRLNSSRFPKKVLANYNGKTLLENVLLIAEKIQEETGAKIVVATDSNNKEIIDIVGKHKADLFLMKEEVCCGSERVKYVYKNYPGFDYYISLPVDEPSINPQEILNILPKIDDKAIYTLWTRFYSQEDLVSKYSCKLVTNNDIIIYTSRSIVPASKDGFINLKIYKKHVGVFVFPEKMLKYDIWKKTENADIEGLEQNMFLNREFKFKAIEIKHNGFGVDSQEQISALEKRFNLI